MMTTTYRRFDAPAGHTTMALTDFRRKGTTVTTPVRFGRDGDRLMQAQARVTRAATAPRSARTAGRSTISPAMRLRGVEIAHLELLRTDGELT